MNSIQNPKKECQEKVKTKTKTQLLLSKKSKGGTIGNTDLVFVKVPSIQLLEV